MYDNRYLLVFVDILGPDTWHCDQLVLRYIGSIVKGSI